MDKLNIRHEKFILLFHNRYTGNEATCLEEIPTNCLAILGDMPLIELKRPFLIEALRAGKATRQCMRIYDLTEREVRALGRRVGIRK